MKALGIENIQSGLVWLLTLWVIVLSVVIYKQRTFLDRLSKGTSKKNIAQILESILAEQDISQKQIKQIISRCEQIEDHALRYVQKLGMVRFNPFDDVGGDQSFCIALLDQHDNGLVISSLHSRTGTRIYAKPVKSGKGTKYPLSKEEQESINSSLLKA
ncbi:MAG: DUF4446 family protein [Candidatus Levybacteria bacterium]|nr:DUF4446 family protein [Candidatus Levybacteria bacterium]